MKVFVHLADGFEEIEALTPVDLLRRADAPVETVSIMGRRDVTGAHGVTVKADALFEDVNYDDCAAIVLPGGMPGAANLAAHEGLKKQLLSFAAEGRRIAAICASPSVVLGPLGVLKGRKATCYPGMEDGMIGAIVTPGDVVIDGNVVTSRGPATAMPFAIALLTDLAGEEKADEIAAGTLYRQNI
jgi:4-methyl-5(b-hydroxyethyl)-thiazole monophosphate biosynthesis